MKEVIFICLVLIGAFNTYAQHKLTLSIRTIDSRSPLAGATTTIDSLKKTVIADSVGLVFYNELPPGTYDFEISFVGYQKRHVSISIPQQAASVIEILLEEHDGEEEEVVITATRTSRSISDIPTRVEIISG